MARRGPKAETETRAKRKPAQRRPIAPTTPDDHQSLGQAAEPGNDDRTRRRGRPRGKRSNPEFEQVTVYIRRKTHQLAKIELIRRDVRQQFSDLVEELLSKWLLES